MIDSLNDILRLSEALLGPCLLMLFVLFVFTFLLFGPSLALAYTKKKNLELAKKLKLEYVSDVFKPEPELDWFFRRFKEREYFHHMLGQTTSGIQFELFDYKYTRTERRNGKTVQVKFLIPAKVLAIRCTNPHIPEFRLTEGSPSAIGQMWGSAYRGEIDEVARDKVLKGYDIEVIGSQTSFFDQFPEKGFACINPYATTANLEQGWFIWQDSQVNDEKMIRSGLKFYKYLLEHAKQFEGDKKG
jgi:hypothetical protein